MTIIGVLGLVLTVLPLHAKSNLQLRMRTHGAYPRLDCTIFQTPDSSFGLTVDKATWVSEDMLFTKRTFFSTSSIGRLMEKIESVDVVVAKYAYEDLISTTTKLADGERVKSWVANVDSQDLLLRVESPKRKYNKSYGKDGYNDLVLMISSLCE